MRMLKLLYKKSLLSSIVDCSPIAKALSILDANTQATVSRIKFKITYMICKEGLALLKMSALCEVEEKHEDNLENNSTLHDSLSGQFGNMTGQLR